MPTGPANSKQAAMCRNRTEENLSDGMKERRRRFVNEYIKDFNPQAAFLRSGGAPNKRRNTPYMYLREPYTRGLIDKVIEQITEEDLVTNKQVLVGLLREANFDGYKNEHGARVSAWKALAKIKGMEAPIKVETDVMVRGGVMLVPILPTSSDWEKAAIESQAQLKEDVKK